MLSNVFTRDLHASSGGPSSATFKLTLPEDGRLIKAQISLGRMSVGHAHSGTGDASYSVNAYVREICVTGGGCFDLTNTKPHAVAWFGVTSVTFQLDVVRAGLVGVSASALASWFFVD